MSGVASDASLPGKRDHGAARDARCHPPEIRTDRRREPPGQDGRHIARLQQMPRCAIEFGCIARPHVAARATAKGINEDRSRGGPFFQLRYSTRLVNRSLPVS
jgi:hypothetical protein